MEARAAELGRRLRDSGRSGGSFGCRRQEVNLIGELSDAAARREPTRLCAARRRRTGRSTRRSLAGSIYARINTGAEQHAVRGRRPEGARGSRKADAQPSRRAIEKARALIENGYDEEADELLTDPARRGPRGRHPGGRSSRTIARSRPPRRSGRRATRPRRRSRSRPPWPPTASEHGPGRAAEGRAQATGGAAGDRRRRRRPRHGGADRRRSIVLALLRSIRDGPVLHVRRRIVVEAVRRAARTAPARRCRPRCRIASTHGREGSSARLIPRGRPPARTRACPCRPASPRSSRRPASLRGGWPTRIDRLLPNRTWVLAGQFLPAEPQQRRRPRPAPVPQEQRQDPPGLDTLRQAEFQAPPRPRRRRQDSPPRSSRISGWQSAVPPSSSTRIRTTISVVGRTTTRQPGHGEVAELRDGELGRHLLLRTSREVARELYRRALERRQEYSDARFGMAVIDLEGAEGRTDKLQQVDGELTEGGRHGARREQEPVVPDASSGSSSR